MIPRMKLPILTAALMAAPAVSPLLAAPDDDALHPGFSIETVLDAATAPEITGMAFLPDGRMAFSHWGGNRDRVVNAGKVVLFSPVSGDPARKWTARDLATGLMDPAGLAYAGGSLYVGETNRISRIGLDGVRSTLADVVTSGNNHEYNYSMVHKGGRLYATLGQAFPPAPSRDRGVLLEANPADGRTTLVAGGLREPNGLAEGPGGELFATDNQGHWVPTSKLVHIAPGRDYGFDNPLAPFGNVAPTPPAIWLPHGELFNSPGQPAYLDKGPFAGQMLIGDVCGGGIRRAYLEKVKGVWQGAVMRFLRKGIVTGPLRMVQSTDGSVWVGGLRGIPGFNCDYFPGGGRNGLHRLVPTGKSLFEVQEIRSREGGFEIAFTRAAAAAGLADRASYEMDHFRYQSTADYGGPKLDASKLTPAGVRPAPDGRSVAIDVPGLKEGFVVHFRFRNLRSDSGQSLWQEEAWYTLNRQGRADPPVSILDDAAGLPESDLNGRIKVSANGLESTVAGPHRIRVADSRGRILLDAFLQGPARLSLPPAEGGGSLLLVKLQAGGRSSSFRLIRIGAGGIAGG